MIHHIALAWSKPQRRRAAAAIAVAAALGLAFEPYLVLAQTAPADASSEPAPKAKAPAKTAKKRVSHHTATDFVSDDLNRREAERAAQVVRDMEKPATSGGPSVVPAAAIPPAKPPAVPAPAAAAAVPVAPPSVAPTASRPADQEAPTVAAIPSRAPIVSASLTPDVSTSEPPAAAQTQAPAPSLSGQPAQPLTPQPMPVAPRQMAQTQPPGPAPAPSPVPIQPPAGGTAGAPAIISGASGRPFGQGQMVPTQQPTLRLEVSKGTAIKLPGPASTVFVAAPDIADVQVKSPSIIYVFAKKPGDTVLYAVDDHDRVLLNTIVSVTSPLSRVKGALDQIYPNNGVTFDNQGETIVLSGTVYSAQIAEDARKLALQQVNNNPAKVISNIRVDAPNQVQLRVKVAEVRRDALKRVGINWQNIQGLGVAPLIGTLNGGFAISTISAIGGPASAAARLQSGNFDVLLDFLATNNQATVLAEPNLVAMSGETASFLAGGEIPVIAPQAGLTGSTFSVAYKQIGVSLSFTPTIIGDRINLKVAPEVSQLSATGSIQVPLTATAVVTIPATQTRRASTTVELNSGQSFAIAGLLQHTGEQDVTKLPWLGDIPILGALFKSDAYQKSETELVIVITPYLVAPSDSHLRTPLTGRVPPTDVDRLLMQRYNHPTPPQRIPVGGPMQQQGIVGATAGFKLD